MINTSNLTTVIKWSTNILMIHYNDVKMRAMASQTTGISIVCWTVCSGGDQRKHQSSGLLALCSGNSPVMFSFDDVIMNKSKNGSTGNIQPSSKQICWLILKSALWNKLQLDVNGNMKIYSRKMHWKIVAAEKLFSMMLQSAAQSQ